jgi:hypothetical protein
LQPKSEAWEDKELQRISRPIEVIRAIYGEKAAANGGDFVEAYRLSLIARLLPYLGYPDVTPAKKLLTIGWLGQLLNAKEKWRRK